MNLTTDADSARSQALRVKRPDVAESVRFVLVGGINTLVGYGLFTLLQLTIGPTIGYLGSLYLSYVMSTGLAFVLHRRFTFRVSGTGNVVVDFVRFVGVYGVSLLVNTIALPLLVEAVGMNPLVAQAIIVLVMTISTYLGHKLFSFRRIPQAGQTASTAGLGEQPVPERRNGA